MDAHHIIVWDLETVPDIEAARRILGMDWQPDHEVRNALGSGFPKLPLHKIVCIGALIAKKSEMGWELVALGAPHITDRPEPELIGSFVERVGELKPQLVTFNGNGFDLPVLRYRAMLHSLPASGLHVRPYFHRYTDDALDLCDTLSAYQLHARPKLDDLSKIFGLAGKPQDIDGGKVEDFVQDGRIQEVADYCETDVVNTFRIWLRYEVFRGFLNPDQLKWSEVNLKEHVLARTGNVDHLKSALGIDLKPATTGAEQNERTID